MRTIEYRVKPVTRFVVTRYEGVSGEGQISTLGEYDNEEIAYAVGYALCKAEHDRLGFAPGYEGIIYPAPVPPTLTPLNSESVSAAA